MLRASSTAAASLLVALVCPVGALADEFCEGLRTVVADAPSNFANTRGRPDAATGYFTQPFIIPEAAPLYPNGASCIAAEFPPRSQKVGYGCVFEGPTTFADAKAEFAAFVQRVEDCLSLPRQQFDLTAPADRGRLGSANGGPITLPVANANVVLVLSYPPHGGRGSFNIQVESR